MLSFMRISLKILTALNQQTATGPVFIFKDHTRAKSSISAFWHTLVKDLFFLLFELFVPEPDFYFK